MELGGACRTEWASAIADQYYYLMGPHGPGKRRRRSLINVLTGKLSHISTSNKGTNYSNCTQNIDIQRTGGYIGHACDFVSQYINYP